MNPNLFPIFAMIPALLVTIFLPVEAIPGYLIVLCTIGAIIIASHKIKVTDEGDYFEESTY